MIITGYPINYFPYRRLWSISRYNNCKSGFKGGGTARIIEVIPPYKRLEMLYGKLLEAIEILKIEKNIDDKVRSQIDKVQKEYYLREQIKVIQEELGE